MQAIRSFLQQSIALTDSEWEVFSRPWTRHAFPKKTVLLREGATERYLSFVESGIVRFFIPRADAETDLTFVFAFDGWFTSAYDSFITQTPAIYTVEALADTVLWRLPYAELQRLYATTAIGDRIGRLAAEQLFLIKTARELSLLRDTAQERYLKLLTGQPHLVQRIPLKYLASYIGITPQALSRIRRRIS